MAGEGSVTKLRRMCALTLALSLASCGDNVTRHPQSERLIRAVAPASVIDAAPGDPPQRGAAVVAALLDPDTKNTVGTLDEPAVLQFGSVRGAARDQWGKLFVLDGQASELRVFDGLQESGRPGGAIRVVGGEGEGPGQFQAPVALSISAEDSAVAVFESNGRVSLFHNSEDSVRYLRLQQLRMDVHDGCLLGNTLVVAGRNPESAGSIHLFTLEGRWIRSFGEFYDSDNPFVVETLGQTRVACLAGERGIVSAPVLLPEVRRYAPNGELLWLTVLDDLSPVYVGEYPHGGVEAGTPEEGYHGTTGVAVYDATDLLLLQVAFVQRGDPPPGDEDRPLTYVIDLGTGEGAMVSRSIPRVLHVSGAGAVLSRRFPFPTVEFIAWPGVG